MTDDSGTTGTDDTTGKVPVAYLIPPANRLDQKLVRFDRVLAHRPAHDAEVVLGDGVTVLAGRFPRYGGSRPRPTLDHNSGTILEVQDVPPAHRDVWSAEVRVLRYDGSDDAGRAARAAAVRILTQRAEDRDDDVSLDFDTVGTPAQLSLADPDRLGRYVHDLLGQEARKLPDPPPAWLLPFADADDQHRRAVTAVGVALFQAGVESGTSWVEGWDAAVEAAVGALDALRNAPIPAGDSGQAGPR